jgi:hypothetical protein
MSTLVNIVSIFMAVCAGILGIISYIPGLKDWLDISTPSLSHYFLATILIVLMSKFITLYLILYWRTSPDYTEQSVYTIFIWSYFVSVMMGIFVYFNFAVGQQQRETTLRHLSTHKIMAFFLCVGILFFYGFSSIYAYNQSTTTVSTDKDGNKVKTPLSSLFSSICIISGIDLVLFILLWIRYWYWVSVTA